MRIASVHASRRRCYLAARRRQAGIVLPEKARSQRNRLCSKIALKGLTTLN
jgi:hypothetical protein